MLGLRRWHADAISIPLYISPSQRQCFRRAANASIAAQRYDHPPLAVWACLNYRVRHFASHKKLPGWIAANVGFKACKRILADHPLTDRESKELFRPTAEPRAVFTDNLPKRYRRYSSASPSVMSPNGLFSPKNATRFRRACPKPIRVFGLMSDRPAIYASINAPSAKCPKISAASLIRQPQAARASGHPVRPATAKPHRQLSR